MGRKSLLAILFLISSLARSEPRLTNTPPDYQRDKTQSFYEPGSGTHNVTYAANHLPIKFWGKDLPADLIVASDIGTNISRFSRKGVLSWRVNTYPKTVRSIDIEGDNIVAHADTDKLVINAKTGEIIKTEKNQKIYLFNKISSGLRISGVDDSGKGMIKIGEKILSLTTKWARDAIVTNNRVYISDTFGHRVIILDRKTLKIISTRAAYFPNDLFLIDGNVILVEEHANRLINVDTGEIIFACPIWIYMQNKSPIENIEKNIEKYNSTEKIGRCAREFMGPNTLYSANSAIYTENTIIVADTDNHRIISIIDGNVVTELQNVNNPVRIMAAPN
ncbi:hypothetical protein WP8S17C03_43870 [Metapseudomonas otitidis]|uniref:Uncharacterized protein n=1 Tax=Metapseudomonas otitidis TaxID=319939 RepID=A0A6S5RRQ2_9GAMM|nr:hypothetical protein [Pseudomonas otitidis]BBT18338.1 hypothetical protein WP8S17C03_43870 [Pseudomonas otitidis]